MATRSIQAAIVLGLLALLPTLAGADIYHYVDDDGNHHFTSYRVRGMELVEVIQGDSSSRRDSSRSSSGRSSSRSEQRAPARQFDPNAFDALITEAAAEYQLPFAFIKAVIRAESAFNPQAVSRAGAQGLMQLMPGTAEDLGVADVFDPRENIFGGSRYLRILADRYNGDINLVLSAYNAGPGTVAEHDGIPFDATRRYIQTVYRYYQEYLEQ